MRARFLTLMATLVLGLFASIAAGCGDDDEGSTASETGATSEASAPEDGATGEVVGPDSEGCVDAWNDGANAAGQEALLSVFADGVSGTVIVGSEDGACVLTAFTEDSSDYLLYRQSGDAFAEADGGPIDQFLNYSEAIDPIDVILQPSGEVEPV